MFYTGTNPGLGFRPINVHGSLIHYNASNNASVEEWVQLIDDFFERKFYFTYNFPRNNDHCLYKNPRNYTVYELNI